MRFGCLRAAWQWFNKLLQEVINADVFSAINLSERIEILGDMKKLVGNPKRITNQL